MEPFPFCASVALSSRAERSAAEGPAVVILSAGGVSPPEPKDPYGGA